MIRKGWHAHIPAGRIYLDAHTDDPVVRRNMGFAPCVTPEPNDGSDTLEALSAVFPDPEDRWQALGWLCSVFRRPMHRITPLYLRSRPLAFLREVENVLEAYMGVDVVSTAQHPKSVSAPVFVSTVRRKVDDAAYNRIIILNGSKGRETVDAPVSLRVPQAVHTFLHYPLPLKYDWEYRATPASTRSVVRASRRVRKWHLTGC